MSTQSFYISDSGTRAPSPNSPLFSQEHPAQESSFPDEKTLSITIRSLSQSFLSPMFSSPKSYLTSKVSFLNQKNVQDLEALEKELTFFEDFYRNIFESVQMDLHKRDPRKITVQNTDNGLVLVDSKESSWVMYDSSPEEVIKILESILKRHETFIKRVNEALKSSSFSEEFSKKLKIHGELLYRLYARLIQARDAHPKEPHIHRQYSLIAERILELESSSSSNSHERLLGSSYTSSNLFAAMKSISMRRSGFKGVSPPGNDHVEWVRNLFDKVGERYFTDKNQGCLLQLSAILRYFDQLNSEGKEEVGSGLLKFLKNNFNIDLQHYKRTQVFSPEALEFFSEILNNILPTNGLESDGWVKIPDTVVSDVIKDLLEELDISLFERKGKCVVFSNSHDDFKAADGCIRSHVNTLLGALTSEMDPKKLDKYLQLSKELVAFFQKKEITHACFSGVLRAGAYMQLLRYQTEVNALANHQGIRFCGIFRGALDYLPLFSRFSQLDSMKYYCEDTDLSTHHAGDNWTFKTPSLTTVPGAILNYKGEFTSLGVTDHTLNSRDFSRYIYGQDRYIEYFIDVMQVCQQLVDKIRPLKFGINEEKAIFIADAEALLRAEKTCGILEVQQFLDKILSLKAAVANAKEFSPTVCNSLQKIPLDVAIGHIEKLPLYRQVELYLETNDSSYLKGFTRLSDYFYGIQDADGNTVIFCTEVYNTPLVAGPNLRGIAGFPVSTTMEPSYCSKEISDKIRAFCGPNPTTYIGCGATADSISVMARVHKNLSPELSISVICLAPRLGNWGEQLSTRIDTDKRLKGEDDEEEKQVDIISILSTDDSYGDKFKQRLENRGAVLLFNRVNELPLSKAERIAKAAKATVAVVGREAFSGNFGTSISCLERNALLRIALEPILNKNHFLSLDTSFHSGDMLSANFAATQKVFDSLEKRKGVWPTKSFKVFLKVYGKAFASVKPPLITESQVHSHLASFEGLVQNVRKEKESLEKEGYILELKSKRNRLKQALKDLETRSKQHFEFLQAIKPIILGQLERVRQEGVSPCSTPLSKTSSGSSEQQRESFVIQTEDLCIDLKEHLESSEPLPPYLYQAFERYPEEISEPLTDYHQEASTLRKYRLDISILSKQQEELEIQLRNFLGIQEGVEEQEELLKKQKVLLEKVKGIEEKWRQLQLENQAAHQLDIGQDALKSFVETAKSLPSQTRLALIKEPKICEGWTALQARYLFGKKPEERFAFLADVGESRFAANSQNGARLVRDLATGKYVVVFKPVKNNLSWADYVKRKGGQISHTLVSDGGMREMEQLHELWAQELGKVLGTSCTLTEGAMIQLSNKERGVALPFLTGYKSASQCKGLLDRLHSKEQIGKVHDFFAINIISGDQDGHLENWMIHEQGGVLKDVRWIDAGNAFTWNDPSSWWENFSPNYRAWKDLIVSQKPFEGVFSRDSLKSKLSTYNYAGVQKFAGDTVDAFREKVYEERFQMLLKDNRHKQEHFERMLTRMQRRLEALLLYICTDPKATPAGAARYTYDQPQTLSRINDWSVESFLQKNKDKKFVD